MDPAAALPFERRREIAAWLLLCLQTTARAGPKQDSGHVVKQESGAADEKSNSPAAPQLQPAQVKAEPSTPQPPTPAANACKEEEEKEEEADDNNEEEEGNNGLTAAQVDAVCQVLNELGQPYMCVQFALWLLACERNTAQLLPVIAARAIAPNAAALLCDPLAVERLYVTLYPFAATGGTLTPSGLAATSVLAWWARCINEGACERKGAKPSIALCVCACTLRTLCVCLSVSMSVCVAFVHLSAQPNPTPPRFSLASLPNDTPGSTTAQATWFQRKCRLLHQILRCVR